MGLLYNLKRAYIKLFKGKVFKSKSAVCINTTCGMYSHIAAGGYLVNSGLGDYTSIGRNSTVINAELGKFCSISWNVTIGATAHHTDRLSTHAFPYTTQFDLSDMEEKIVSKTYLGNDVWVGAGAIILPGIKIGNGAIIGAGAVVTNDVPPYAICAGVPAKVLRFRFSEELIAEIEKMQWWNWSHQKLKENLPLFRGPVDLSEFSKS